MRITIKFFGGHQYRYTVPDFNSTRQNIWKIHKSRNTRDLLTS